MARVYPPGDPPRYTPAVRVLVVGCGGIGGNVAAGLSGRDGLDVVALSTNREIVTAVNRDGYVLVDGSERAQTPGRAVAELDPTEAPFDLVVLATQPPQVEDAARSVLGHLTDDADVLVLQNGLCEDRVARIVGPHRVVGGIVAWGASMLGPGVYERTSSGGFHVGRPGGGVERLDGLARVLEFVGPVELTHNLAGARWSKLAMNCAISTLGTIGGERLGALLRQQFVRRLALEVMTEVVDVARAEGVTLEKVSGTIDLHWLALTPAERATKLGSPGLLAKHSLLVAVGTRYRNLRSSMLSAIERGRPPAVDFLNGEVEDRGRAHGVATPVNGAARALVHAIARGEAASGPASLRALFEATRGVRGVTASAG